MIISLVICTKNRAAILPACLDSVRELQMPRRDWELIMVDNGSTDRTAEIINGFAQNVDFDVRHLYEPRRGSGRAKNAALAQARGQIIAFTDDDCYVRPDYLQQIVRVFESESVGYVGGRVILHDPSDAFQAVRLAEVPTWIEPYSFLAPGFIIGANMAVLRTVCESVGGFDPLFGAGAIFTGEDIDLAARASWAGWRGMYDPGPVVSHHHRRKPDADGRSRMREYEHGRGGYYAKFLLNRRAQALYFRHWFWSARRASWRGGSSVGREVLGATRYILCRLAGA